MKAVFLIGVQVGTYTGKTEPASRRRDFLFLANGKDGTIALLDDRVVQGTDTAYDTLQGTLLGRLGHRAKRFHNS